MVDDYLSNNLLALFRFCPRRYFGGIAIVLLLFVGIWAYALVDCITTTAERCRNLPKVAWVLLVVFVPLLGSLLWFGFGRPPGGVFSRFR